MRGVLIFTLILAFFALVFACVATGLNTWYSLSVGDNKAYFGLWNECVKLPLTGVKCSSWTEGGDVKEARWLHACQAMMILAILFYVLGMVAVILHVAILNHTRQLVKLAGILFVVGGVCSCIACIVFAVKYKDLVKIKGGHLFAGFGIAVASTVFGFVSGIMAISTKQSSYASF